MPSSAATYIQPFYFTTRTEQMSGKHPLMFIHSFNEIHFSNVCASSWFYVTEGL